MSFTITQVLVPATVLLGASTPISVTVTSSADLTDLACLPRGPDLTTDPTNTTCKASVTASTPCVFAFTFKATTLGPKTDDIECSTVGVSKHVPVAPTVLSAGPLSIAPSRLEFAAPVRSTSSPQSLSITNTGTYSSGNPTTVLGGTDAEHFAIASNTCVTPVAPPATCSIQVVFKPKTYGPKTATLTVTDDALGTTPIVVPLAGTGITDGQPPPLTGPASLGNVVVGTTGKPSTYSLSNYGGTATDILTVTIADLQFAISDDQCSGFPLAPGKTCSFSVAYTPTKLGMSNALLNVTMNGALVASLAITGNGVKPAELQVRGPLYLQVVVVGTVGTPLTYEVVNFGGGDSDILTVATSSPRFTLADDRCSGIVLAPDQICTFAVAYAPTKPGFENGTATVSSKRESPATVNFIGEGIYAETPDAAPMQDAGVDSEYGDAPQGDDGTDADDDSHR